MQDATSLSPDKVYDRRFNDMETFRNAMWSVLCRDFFQRYVPAKSCIIDDRALVEVLELIGFQMTCAIPRFLPYSTQSKLPKSTQLIRWYLKMPFLWPLFGGQAFLCGEKRCAKQPS